MSNPLYSTFNAAGLVGVYSGLLQLPQEIVIVRWLILAAVGVVSIIVVLLKAKWGEVKKY